MPYDNASQDSGETETFIYGMTRREAVKHLAGTGALVGTGALAGCSGDGDGDGNGGGTDTETTNGDGNGNGNGNENGDGDGNEDSEKIEVPRNDDAFADTDELNLYGLAIVGPTLNMMEEGLNEESGITVGEPDLVEVGELFSKLNNRIISGNIETEVVNYPPLYFGNLASRDALEPLGPYLDQYEGMDALLGDMIPEIREFYTKYDGEILGMPRDGDVQVLHYRPSYFEDETHQEQYEDTYGEELRVPKTWPEFNQVAEYFTENTEDDVYGAQINVTQDPNTYSWWMNYAASKGVIYFDEDMNPGINTPEAVEALETMIDTLEHAPPGGAQFGIQETITNWQNGNVVMSPWWSDLSVFTARGDFEASGDQATARMPGWEQDDGSVRANAMIAGGHIMGIPRDIPDSQKEAAFYAIMRTAHPDYSNHFVVDAFTGMDPFLNEHYSQEVAENATKPNPLRGTAEMYPENPPIAESAEEAYQIYLTGHEENMKIAFPKPVWPGSAQYIEALNTRLKEALAGQTEPKEALDSAADEWETILDELGRDSQQEAYQQFLAKARDLDLI